MKPLVRTFISFVALCTLALLTLLFLPSCSKKQPETKEIKIGAILPLTGSAAPYGENAKRGIELALSEIKSKDKVVKILYEDSKTDPKEAVSALNKLFNLHGIRLIIGDINSSGLLAMAPIAERNKIILMSPGASNPKISDAGEYIFRNWHSDALEGEVDARYAFSNMGWKTTAVLYVDAAYGVGLAETFRNVFNTLGGKTVAFEAYAQDATDMRSQISKIIAAKPNGLYLPGWPKEMAVVLKQLKELGSEIPILSAQGFDDPSILKLSANAAEGVIFSVPETPDPNNEIAKSFNENYRIRYSQEPGVCSASGYDALRIFAYAINKVGDDIEQVQKIIASLKDFPGADGPITFDEHGDLLKPFSFKVVKNGKFTSID